jgi:2-methylcitrate dehydratase PrpD
MTNHPKISSILSKFIFETEYEHIPASVIHEAKRSLINFFAVCLAAGTDDTISKAIQVYQSFSSNSCANVIGRNIKTDILNAAALNAMAANVFDFDDTHIPTIIHPTAPVAAALFALSQHLRLNGREFLLAHVLGVDIECRIGNAVSPQHYSRGWHITSTCGVFGAASATGKALSLNVNQLLWALGNASVQASGLVETLGTMSKSISVGNAARNGLLSALLANNDFSGPDLPLEGERGFLNVYGQELDFDALQNHLGIDWEIQKNTYKPYPCGVVLNPVIEACLELFVTLREKNIDLKNLDVIKLTGHPLLRQRTDRPNVLTGRESQVSAQHAVGIVLVYGKAGLSEFSDEAIKDAVAKWVGSKVKFLDDPQMSVDAATVEITFVDKSQLLTQISKAKGSLSIPLSDHDLERKLISLSSNATFPINTHKLIDQIWSLDSADDVSLILDV